ncbi:MAG: ArnT family glycosyltransferase [Anaerolineae bacterium]
MTRGYRGAALLLAAALGLAALGQFYFFRRREYLWDGLVFHLLAAFCFWQAWRRSQVRLRRPGCFILWIRAWLRDQPVPTALSASGLFLSTIAGLWSRDRALDQSTYDVAIFWALGVGMIATAALWPSSWSSSLTHDWRTRLRGLVLESWPEVIVLAGVTVLAFLLRVIALENIPYTVGGDEAWHGLLGRQVLTGQLRNPFSMGYMSMPTAFYWPIAWSLWLIGDNIMGLRFPAALIGTLTVPVFYLFVRDLWGQRTALLSTLLLATYDYHIHYSRLGANNIWDPLPVILALWALDRGLISRQENPKGSPSVRYFLWAGLAAGLGVYFYTSARLLPLLMALYVIFVQLRKGPSGQRREPGQPVLGLQLGFLCVAFLIAAGPMLSYAVTHPNEWNARINQVGIIQSGWLAREPGLTGKSTAQILVEQFLRAAGAFHVFPDRTVWYGADRPLLGPLAGLFAMLGMAWAGIHWRDRRYFLVMIWFWSVIITGGMLTESPPSSQRLVIAIPAVVLLVGFGLEQSVDMSCSLLRLNPKRKQVPLILFGLILAVSSVRFYFVEFTPQRRYGGENGETATLIGHYLHRLQGNYRAYFLGAPRIYWNFGTMEFLAPEVSGQDVIEPLTAPPDFVGVDRQAIFILLPERAGELFWVQQTFPDGRIVELRDGRGRLRCILYETETFPTRTGQVTYPSVVIPPLFDSPRS